MKLSYFVIALLMAMTAMISQSCSSADHVLPEKSQDYALLSRSDAQAQLDELIDSNTFVDLDLANYVPSPKGQISEYEIYQRVIFYRFYKQMRIENNRITVDGTAADLNISERAFNHCMNDLVIKGNEIIADLITQGYAPQAAAKKVHYITPESIELVRRFR